MLTFIHTNSQNAHFQELVALLDADLQVRDGDEHPFYAQYNKLHDIKYVIVAYQNERAVGCGAIKEYDAQTMEVKRMYVQENMRGQGIASQILATLESWAKELAYPKCILETGKKQPEAIALYLKNGYQIIPNYGQYQRAENSICFEKRLPL